MLQLNSPAKINLFLKIKSRRPDGYHELASLFQAVDLNDSIQFALSKQDCLTCSQPDIPVGESNLIWKAMKVFKVKTGLNFHLNVHLEKNIPHQAGLGGGSSNAATALWAINQLLGTPASESDLLEWAAEVGSDVPFFFSSGTAYCLGKGEIVKSLPQLFPEKKLWIIKPDEGTSTPVVYRQLILDNLSERDPDAHLQEFLNGKPSYFNDLEEAAFSTVPRLLKIKETLMASGFQTVLLSGSGSSFFCIGEQAPPRLTGCKYYNVKFTRRNSNQWY